MNRAKDFTPANLGRSVENTRTGDVAEFLGTSALDPNVINIALLDGSEIAAPAADWDLVY
ncbi:hypothetical protein [Pseudonocardia sp. NPDC049635]|uniref:hypothetical protein n=1 Tax=Pseudonocardia sp. NPDC049635 TaxID=3155506 RepID=UPI0033CB4A0A